MNILVLDNIHGALVEMLHSAGHTCTDLSAHSDEAMIQHLPDAEGIVLRSRLTLNAALIDRCPRLKFIGRVGAGMEHIDVMYAESKGIEVISSPEGNRQAVAEHALALLLAMFNHVVRADTEVRKGLWQRKENEGIELQGKTVGIVGYGNTGSAFARVLSGFDVNIVVYDKYQSGFGTASVQECAEEDIFEKADVVSLHLPLNDETRMLVCTEWINRFKKPFYLINTSRGGIANTTDMLEALDNNRLLGACLDVLEFETENLKMPPLETLPSTAKRLMAHPKVLLSPHVAGLTVESYAKLSRVLAEKIISRFGRA